MEYAEFEHLDDGGGGGRGRGRRGHKLEFKSKNLQAERRRRQKLSDRLLALRSLVPNITNMNKATIVEDAITYIKNLQKNVKDLSDHLLQMEAEAEAEAEAAAASSGEEAKQRTTATDDDAEDMNKHEIQEEFKVIQIGENKLWLKIVIQKKRSSFTRLVEAMNFLGFEFTDTSVTTSKGAILVSACVEGVYGESLAVEETREMLQEIIRGMQAF